MTYTLNFFPNQYLDILKETVPKMNGLESVDIFDRNEKFSMVVIKCSDPTYIWLLGIWMGETGMAARVKEVMPQVEKNVENLIKNVTTQSNN